MPPELCSICLGQRTLARLKSCNDIECLRNVFMLLSQAKRGSRKVSIPPELCIIRPGQRKLKLEPGQTDMMIKFTARQPEDRRQYIQARTHSRTRIACIASVLCNTCPG